ncbi:MAG: IS5/IS1182 family transposase, partial [Candidatus Methanoperedens sp.]
MFSIKIKKQIDKVQEESEKADSAISFTDPDCRFMPNSKKVTEYSYNPQVAVDSSFGIIISSDVTSEATDKNNLQPTINQVEENMGELPEGTKVSSDNGYYSSLNLKFLKEKR